MDNLQEAYLSVYQELDEASLSALSHESHRRRNPQGAYDKNRSLALRSHSPRAFKFEKNPETGEWSNLGRRDTNTTEPEVRQKVSQRALRKRNKVPLKGGRPMFESSSDLFDYLLEYLVAEGYADTNDAAIAIMANMSEEWRAEILDERNRGDEYATRGMSPEDAKTWKSERRNKTRGFGSDVEEKNKMDKQYKRKYGKPPAPDPNYIGSGQRRRQSDTKDNRGKRTTLVHTTSDTLSPSGIRGTITKPEIKIGTPLGGAKNPEPTGKYLRQQQIKNNPYYS